MIATELEDLTTVDVSMSQEPTCEAEHEPEDECTVKAVARKRVRCAHSFLICQVSYEHNLEWIGSHEFVCEGCDDPIEDCWEIIPL